MAEIITNIENSVYKGGVAQEDNQINLTVDQEHAITMIKNWFSRKGSSPAWKKYYVLSGAAGTGKSSLIQYIINNLKIDEYDVLCCAFTGKASLNLQRKGNFASTLHSSIYECKKIKGRITFKKRDTIPYKLIIVDEASMISKELFDDILYFGVPTIFIGDHCQLPPIEGSFNIMKMPDFTLKTIMRQAAKSPIIRASQLAINGENIPFCEFKDGSFRKIKKDDLQDSDFLWADQIIVGTNNTRHALNALSREIRGIESINPIKGERMIVLKNNSRLNICNGQIIQLTSNPSFFRPEGCFYTSWADELELIDPFLAFASDSKEFKFKMKDPNNEPDSVNTWNYAYLDYGYAISCHKSQGSGWNKVMVFDEGFGFDMDTQRRWLYTAITRAQKQIVLVK